MSDPDTFIAQIRNWTQKAKDNMDLVVRQATQDMFEAASERQASASETGGSFVVGKVPVDTGFLIGTSEVRINGSPVSGGSGARGEGSTPPDFVAAIGQLQMGETIEFVYTADYARPLHYGHGNVAGRLWVTTALARWQEFVDQAAARFR